MSSQTSHSPSSVRWFSLFVLFGLFAALRLTAANAPAPAQCGLCYANNPDGERVLVPLESTEVVLNVKPGLMEAEVVQTFTNRTTTALEAVYLYPLPAGATLTDFEIRYQDRVVRSVVREKNAAQATYETAKAEGRKTALLEQHDPSLFSTSVANFLPGETVHVVIRFIQPLVVTAENIKLRFPMVTGNKYFPAAATPDISGAQAPNPTRISGDQLSARHFYAFDIQVAGIPAQTIFSESHQINVQNLGADLHRISLVDEITVPDRDFLLQINTRQSAELIPTVVTQHTSTGDYGLLTVFPPLQNPGLDKTYTPRDVIFLIDHSGSMDGTRMESARLGLTHCLPMLKASDRFRIVIFDDDYESFRPDWSYADAASLDAAQKYCLKIHADGGTEVQKALGPCLDLFEKNNRDHLLIFLTDGDVGNADSLLTLVENKIGRARLFAFGIGDAPNEPLIAKMATAGHGQARFIKNDSAVDQELADFFATVNAPVLSSLRLSLLDAQGQPIDAVFFPAKVSDVFLGRPLQAIFRNTGQPAALLQIDGQEENLPVTIRVPLAGVRTRGEGMAKHFGRMWYEDLAAEWRRAPIGETKNQLRTQMLDTALLFELVTELTSRVAVEDRVSRAPDAPLVSQKVAQIQPADQVRADGTIVLSPFEICCDADSGYSATDSLAGCRLRTELRDIGSAVTVVTKQFLDDIAAQSNEALLAYTTEPQQNPALARSGPMSGLLDFLPIATVIDPATIDRIDFHSNTTALSNVSQRKAYARNHSQIVFRLGDEGYLAGTAETTFLLAGNRSSPALALVSWQNFAEPQWSALFDIRHDAGDHELRGSVQARRLAGYGGMELLRASYARNFDNRFWFQTTLASHRLHRTNPQQFELGSTTAQYDNLGFLNLDLLTANTRDLQDQIAAWSAGWDQRVSGLHHSLSVETVWHRQKAQWDDMLGDSARSDLGTNAVWQLRSANSRFSSRLNYGLIRHSESALTVPHETTRDASLGLGVEVVRPVRLFASFASREILPFVPTGLGAVAAGQLRRIAQPVEQRDHRQAGLDLDFFSGKLTGNVALFHETIRNHSFRDWAWERDHATTGAVVGSDGQLRLPVSYATAPEWQREGWLGEIDWMPTREFRCRATWYCDWKNNGPYRGGNRQASLVTTYDFHQGKLRGWTAGFTVSTRNTMRFNDGYQLAGGLRWDLLLGYERKLASGQKQKLQLNMMNLTGSPWQPTRFAKDHGRQILLSVLQEF